MKKLSKELNKSYKILIYIFSASFLGILFFFTSYLKTVSFDDIWSVYSFLNYEMSEFKEEILEVPDEKVLFYGALEEAPKVEGLTIIFKHDNNFYPHNIPKFYKDLINSGNFSDDIQSTGFYKYDFLNKKTFIENMGEVDLLIIKDLKNDRLLLFNIIFASIIIISFAIVTSIYISKKFYRKFIFSLNSLQEITNRIDLNTLDHKFVSKNNFIEFNNVMSSYENMLKRLKEQTDAQIDFVNNASHELKTPIFIINGYINLIRRWGINNKEISKEAIDSIAEETQNMSSLVQKLLFLAKDNVSELELKKFSICEIINSIINELKIVYPNQKIIFSSKDFFVESDYHLIKQLFFNLIENAIKYGKGKDINIEIIYNKNISVIIKDKGEGISEENLKHIYDKFFRADKSRSRNMGSHGLGLSIVKKIVNILNIDIDIKSNLGVGTSVIVTLPVLPISIE